MCKQVKNCLGYSTIAFKTCIQSMRYRSSDLRPILSQSSISYLAVRTPKRSVHLYKCLIRRVRLVSNKITAYHQLVNMTVIENSMNLVRIAVQSESCGLQVKHWVVCLLIFFCIVFIILQSWGLETEWSVDIKIYYLFLTFQTFSYLSTSASDTRISRIV